MIIVQRAGPYLAAAAVAASFLVTSAHHRSAYWAAPACLLVLLWVAWGLPATRLAERLERLLVLALPYIAGGWLWLLLDKPDVRQWLPIATVGLVLLSGEVLFQVAYQRGKQLRLWMAIVTALLVWFACTGLALGNLLVARSALVAAGLGSLYVLGLFHHIQWVYSLPRDPWWAQLALFVAYWQVLWAVILLPVSYPAQAAAAMLMVLLGLRLRLSQRFRLLNIERPWASALVWLAVAAVVVAAATSGI